MEDTVKSFLAQPDYDEYEMIKCLKDGDAVRVYLLYDRKCGRKLLLKCSEKEKGCLENEAEILSQLKGEGIPALLRCFDYENCTFLFREYIEGQTLKEYTEGKGRLPEEQAAEIGIKLCDILSYIHSRRPPVIHRDIKAENIVITDDRRVYIVDFGTARDYSPQSSQDTCIMGTPATAPPEQFGFGQTDERSDVYSLGVLLHRLVTGTVDLKKGVAPGRIRKVIKRCTGFSPDERYEGAAELKKALLPIRDRKRSRAPRLLPVMAVVSAVSALIAAGAVKMLDGGFLREAASAPTVPYQFKDPTIEAEVCRLLGKELGTVEIPDLYTVTSIRMVGNTSFDAEDEVNIDTHGANIQINREEVSGQGRIISLEDISAMPNLTELILCNQCISDLSPLRKSRIRRLFLHGNNIFDLSPLSSCYYLEELVVSDNRISDFSPLIGCVSLTFLNAGANDLTDLKDIARIESLTRLHIHDCPRLTDYSALNEMSRLTAISLRPVDSTAFDAIGKMTELTWFGLWDMREEADLTKLSGLSQVVNIHMNGVRLKSLEGIENFPRLVGLDLYNIEVDNLYPLTKLENLYTLDLRRGRYGDYSALGSIPSLRDLFVSADHGDAVREWVGENVNLIVY